MADVLYVHHAWRNTVLFGDCLERLREVPDKIVQTCVTSPPYFGLRAYLPEGHANKGDEIGLEGSPREYVANLVEVFREVRRVMRDDGTLWLNLGDSYNNRTKVRTSSHQPALNNFTLGPNADGSVRRDTDDNWADRAAKGGVRMPITDDGLKEKDLIGIPWLVARALQQPYYTGRIRPEAERAWLAGFLDGEGTISFVELDRGENHTSTHDVRVFLTNCDRGPLDYFAGKTAGHVYVHDDGTRDNRLGSRVCYRWQMGTHDSALLLRELYPYLRTKRRQAALIWTLYTTLRHRNGHARTPEDVVARRREIAEMVRALNAGSDVTLPDWVEEPPDVFEPGWYLRGDNIWAKGSCMPEPVNDRTTRSHEYVFHLAKSSSYFYDADSIREPHKPESLARYEYGLKLKADPNAIEGSLQARALHGLGNSERMGDFINPLGRNKRSVWNINPKPYKGAHFATMPPELAEVCVKAGSKVGDLVLDPFAGSGTTLEVAKDLDRDFLGIELNEGYKALIEERIGPAMTRAEERAIFRAAMTDE